MGGRQLKRWLLKPLIQPAPILERQKNVENLVNQPLLLAELRDMLDKMPDMERLLTKIMLGGRNPRDMQALGNALERLPRLHQCLSNSPLAHLAERVIPLPDLSTRISKGLRDSLPMNLADGGVIADGIDATLDELRLLMRDGDSWLGTYEEKERTATGIKTLKVRKNSVFGYFIEISKSLSEKAPAHYVRKQTLVNGERYITAELKDFESKAFTAHDRSTAIEKELFEALVEAARAEIPAIQRAAGAIAELDAFAGLAAIALEHGYVKPVIRDDGVTRIKDGRHPVVEAFLPTGEFTPNDTFFDGTGRMQAIITGPNMAGKSTYLRQVALIVLLAQIGSYVPAKGAEIGVTDRIFTRVGASDNLIRGQSTFMVEMMETANILKFATSRSLLVLDEIGRGTSTFDGLSLAWAILEHINQHLKARTLFATHYHELTDLTPINSGMFNLNVGVVHDPATGGMIFLHKILEGPSDKSYGIEVARLAGIPVRVIERAQEILFELQKSEEDEIRRTTRSKVKSPAPVQLCLFSPADELRDTVRGIDVNRLTPLEALNLLARLKEMTDG
jgi:DNA mismatch repair protein MutS